MPAKAGIHDFTRQVFRGLKSWIPAFAGMTLGGLEFGMPNLSGYVSAYGDKPGHDVCRLMLMHPAAIFMVGPGWNGLQVDASVLC